MSTTAGQTVVNRRVPRKDRKSDSARRKSRQSLRRMATAARKSLRGIVRRSWDTVAGIDIPTVEVGD
jgi:hypothetical protein